MSVTTTTKLDPAVDRTSGPAAGNSALQKALIGRDSVLNSIPSVPAILNSLLAELAQDAEKVDFPRVADLIGRDEALAAQCLRMANSPLFGRGTPSVSMRGAVRTLGISHIRDIAVSCSMMRIGSVLKGVDPIVFWEHSLGSAIVSRKLARSVGFDDPDKAYLAGLMHDLGYVVNLVLLPQQTKAVLDEAAKSGTFMAEAEFAALGFSHCQTGELLGRKWNFTEDLIEVMLCHHNAEAAVIDPGLVAIVSLADRLCRSAGMGMGYTEIPDPAANWQSDWKIVRAHIPRASSIEWADFVKDADAYFGEIREMVTAMFQSNA
jgi:HD-like signal output (HDOD) protein